MLAHGLGIIGRHRLGLAADHRAPFGIGLTSEIANARRILRTGATKLERAGHGQSRFGLGSLSSPSPVNSLGVKGVGEAGTIAASPAIVNAVIDALRPLGVTEIDMPMTPMRVWETIQQAKGGAS